MEYISHIRIDSEGKTIIQTNKEHLKNVAQFSGKWGNELGFYNLCVLIGILHDFGKYTKSFVAYILNSFNYPKKKQFKIDHSTAGAKYIYDQFCEGTEAQRIMAEWTAMAIMSHHSGLENFLGVHGKSDFLRRVITKPENYEEAKTTFFEYFSEGEIKRISELATQEVEIFLNKLRNITKSYKKYYFYSGMIEKMLFSILIDADRLDTANFMTGIQLQQKWNESILWTDFAQKLEKKLTSFPIEKDPQMRHIADARKKISDDCLAFASYEPGIYTLSVPTGSGKTLASMRYALTHAKIYHKKRIIVIIPYTSIIDQNAHEIEDIFQNNDVILEHHSNVISDVENSNRQEYISDDIYSQQAEFKRSLTERWDVPIIFTTQVQFLNTLFAGKTRSIRRLHSMQNSVIIFDEIQTLPVKCTYLFNQAINFLKEFCDVTTVLCTATQPVLGEVDVPLYLSEPHEMVNNLGTVFNNFKRVHIENLCMDGGNSISSIASLIWRDAIKHDDVLCIVNTTLAAKQIYKELLSYSQIDSQNIIIVHLSTKMCPYHRKLVLKAMRRLLRHKTRYKLICVATQLIEAGVDISFTTVYRAVAGLSSIAQAAGRCNRHGEIPYGIVKIFDLQCENLRYLQDIQKGKDAMRDILACNNMESLLQPTVMDEYFLRYYQSFNKNTMKYLMKDKSENLYDILSANEAGEEAFNTINDESYHLENMQAFRDAGKEFCVIDNKTVSILVPYGLGIDYIFKFNKKNYDIKDIYKKIKDAQQFMVNLFSYEVKKLIEFGAVQETENGILYLRKEYYDKKIGVVLEEQKNSFNLC